MSVHRRVGRLSPQALSCPQVVMALRDVVDLSASQPVSFVRTISDSLDVVTEYIQAAEALRDALRDALLRAPLDSDALPAGVLDALRELERCR